MTLRGRWALVLAAAAYLAARAFGSKPLYPVAVGLALTVLVAWVWVRAFGGSLQLRRNLGRLDHVEGDDVRVELSLAHDSRVPLPSVSLVEKIGKLGLSETPLARGRGALRADYELRSLKRGRYPFEETRAVFEDPFGLDRMEVPVSAPGALLVYPRLVELERLFSESGAHAQDGRRLLLRRPSGFDFHSVREYEEGESLRRVHWPSTAKTGQLMVKELEDAPRDEIAVLLDADARAVVGESFEVQVRAAGSILRAHARQARRAVLVVNSTQREVQRVHSYDGDWRRALDVLAAVEPTATASASALLAEESGAAARALELTVVTAGLGDALVQRIVQRALSRRSSAVVFVDAATFNGRGAEPATKAALLRLAAAGVPIAVVRRGDDLATALGAPAHTREAAYA